MAMAHGCVSRLLLSACVVDRGRMDWDWSLVTHPEASASEEVALERAAGRGSVMCTSSGKWLGRRGLAPPGCCR